eukprot:986737-Pleurochrysis_carterae.AAC.2
MLSVAFVVCIAVARISATVRIMDHKAHLVRPSVQTARLGQTHLAAEVEGRDQSCRGPTRDCTELTKVGTR